MEGITVNKVKENVQEAEVNTKELVFFKNVKQEEIIENIFPEKVNFIENTTAVSVFL